MNWPFRSDLDRSLYGTQGGWSGTVRMTQDPDTCVSFAFRWSRGERGFFHCDGNWSFKQKTSPSFFVTVTCLLCKREDSFWVDWFKEMYVSYHQCSRNGQDCLALGIWPTLNKTKGFAPNWYSKSSWGTSWILRTLPTQGKMFHKHGTVFVFVSLKSRVVLCT